MGGYIGATAVGLTTTAADVQGDITSTDTTPELILKNTSEEDTEGGREGKITFKGEQSGGEETTLAQIESAHDGTSDDEKGDLIFKTNDGNDGAAPTERLRLDSAGDMLLSSPDPSFTIANTTQEDTDGGRESTIVFKGKQSGGEESTLAQIQAEHGGTNDDEKGNLVFKVNDGSDGNSPTEAFRIDSLARGSFGSGTDGVPTGFWNGSSYQPYFAIENNGITAASNYVTLGLLRHTADSEASQLGFAVSRGTTTNSKTIVQSGDSLGTITWQGADGSEYVEGARINATVDGTPGANDMPARMEFYTTSDGSSSAVERMRIDSSGNVGIGTSSPSLAVAAKDYI